MLIQRERISKIWRPFSRLLGGKLIGIASYWIFLIALTRVGGAAAVGTYGIAMAIVTPLFMLAQLRTGELIATSMDRVGTRPYRKLLLFTGAAASAAALAAALFVEGWALASAALLLSVVAQTKALGELYYGIAQREGYAERVGTAIALRSVTSCALSLALLFATRDFLLTLAGYALGHLLVYLWFDRTLERESVQSRAPDFDSWRRFKESAPLGAAAGISAVASNTPRYLLEAFVSREAVGIYTAVYASASEVKILNNALSMATLRQLSTRFGAGIRPLGAVLATLAVWTVTLGGAAALAAWFFGDWALGLVYGEAFTTRGGLLTLVFLAGIGGMMNTHVKRTLMLGRVIWQQSITAGFSVLAGVVVGLLLVPSQGLMGGGWSLFAVQWGELAAASAVLALALSKRRGGLEWRLPSTR